MKNIKIKGLKESAVMYGLATCIICTITLLILYVRSFWGGADGLITIGTNHYGERWWEMLLMVAGLIPALIFTVRMCIKEIKLLGKV